MLNMECNDWEEDEGIAKCPYFTDVPTSLAGKMSFQFPLRFVTHPPISSYASIRGEVVGCPRPVRVLNLAFK
jgi:hypothetical protein